MNSSRFAPPIPPHAPREYGNTYLRAVAAPIHLLPVHAPRVQVVPVLCPVDESQVFIDLDLAISSVCLQAHSLEQKSIDSNHAIRCRCTGVHMSERNQSGNNPRHAGVCVYVYVYVYVCVYGVCVYICMYVCVWCVCIYIYVCVYVYGMCVCVCLCVCVQSCQDPSFQAWG
jgi:hypothetical protein